jgi:hypothetical protein
MEKNEKIDQCKYWLLDGMLSRSIFTGCILPESQDSVDISPFISIFSNEEVKISLIELFDSGYLLTSNLRGVKRKFIPTRSRIEIATTMKSDENDFGFYIFLSKKGGREWESLSNPKWNIFTKVLYQIEPEENSGIYEVVIVGKQLSWLKKRVSNLFGDPNLHIYDNRYPKMIGANCSKHWLRVLNNVASETLTKGNIT